MFFCIQHNIDYVISILSEAVSAEIYGRGEQMSDKYPLALKEGTVLAGQYIIQKVLGQGGFGITYMALDHQSGQKVAIKEFFPDTLASRTGSTVSSYPGERSESFQYGKTCFLQEAETLAAFIGNENIVKIHSYFEENGTAYFVMDFVEGISFDEYIRNKGGKISYDDAESILIHIIDALALVHSKGIVHRDVTPDNIYITNDGTVKLLDFGAARYSLGDKSRSLDVVLKHGFAPKEQYTRHGRQGPFTDVYTVGASFYFAVTGKRPPDSIDRLEEDDLVPPSSLGVNIPREKEDVILKAMSVQPGDRFQTMGEFKNALLSAGGVQPAREVQAEAPFTESAGSAGAANQRFFTEPQASQPSDPSSGQKLPGLWKGMSKKGKLLAAAAAAALVLVIAVAVALGNHPSGESDQVLENDWVAVDNIKSSSQAVLDADGNLYYTASDGSLQNYTTGDVIVTRVWANSLSLVGKYLYYVNPNDGKAYRVNKKGGNPEMIFQNGICTIATFYVSDSYYFATCNDGSNLTLVRWDISKKKITGEIPLYFYQQVTFLNGFVFYVDKTQAQNGSGSIYKVPADGDWNSPEAVKSYAGCYVYDLGTDGKNIYATYSRYPGANGEEADFTDGSGRVHFMDTIDPESGTLQNYVKFRVSQDYGYNFFDVHIYDGWIYYAMSFWDASGNMHYDICRTNEKTYETVFLNAANPIQNLSNLSLLLDVDGKEKIAAWVQTEDGYNGSILMNLDGSDFQKLN